VDFIRQSDAKRLTTRMPDAVEKEVQRLIGIAREHARAALAKPEIQRESHLAFCRLNWKRYASGISRIAAEGERFAAALDRATRDLMVLMQDPAMAERVEKLSPWFPLRDDAVEGGMESVTVYEAAVEPELPPPEITPPENAKSDLVLAEELYAQSQPRPVEPVPDPVEHGEAVAAAEEDRQAARFGFGALERPQPLQAAPTPTADPELKRKVQDLLRARQAAKSDDGA
jgi:hypothetical protein